jgi:hypothetical protein
MQTPSSAEQLSWKGYTLASKKRWHIVDAHSSRKPITLHVTLAERTQMLQQILYNMRKFPIFWNIKG